MKEKLVKVFEKAFWPFMICIGIVLFSMLIIGLEKMEIKKIVITLKICSLYFFKNSTILLLIYVLQIY